MTENTEDPNVEVTNHYEDRDPNIVAMGQTPAFLEFLESLEQAAEAGETLANIIATAVMTLFGPGFVLIGSPNMEADEDGTMMPDEVGVCLSAGSDLTPSDLAKLLRRLAIAIDLDVDASLNKLKESE